MKSIVSVLLSCLLVTIAAGQNAGSNEQGKASSPVQTVRGCLSKSANTYVLLGGNPLRQYRIIDGDLSRLRGKQGHVVEVTGPVGEKESGASTKSSDVPDSTTGVGYDTIRADTVKDIAHTCS